MTGWCNGSTPLEAAERVRIAHSSLVFWDSWQTEKRGSHVVEEDRKCTES